MLKFDIRCVHKKKLAKSSDVGFGVIDEGIGHYGDRKSLSYKLMTTCF